MTNYPKCDKTLCLLFLVHNYIELNSVHVCDKDLYLYTTQSRLLMTLSKKPFENIVGKGENTGYQSQKEFLFLSYIYFVVCKCFEFVIW